MTLLSQSGVSCTASAIESSGYVCDYTYDGITDAAEGCDCEWYADNGNSAWVTIELPKMANVRKVQFWFSCGSRGQSNEVDLIFSDSTQQKVSTSTSLPLSLKGVCLLDTAHELVWLINNLML